MNKIEQLEQQLLDMQAELEELKKGKLLASEEEPVKAMLPEQGWWFLDMCNFDPSGTYLQFATDGDQNIFPDKETTEAYADAFRVILELRRQPRSGQLDEEGDGWIIEHTGVWDCADTDYPVFGVCPPFPSSFDARQAGEAVGIERIKRAYATLSGIKGE